MTWLERQAATWADPDQRAAAVRRQFQLRFGPTIDTAGKTLEELRYIEENRIRQLYHALAKEHGIRKSDRFYNPDGWNARHPVKKALSAANRCLYGTVRAAINALGCSTSLAYLHTGEKGAFIYDIADLYKAEITIPAAFSLASSVDPERDARRSFNERMRLSGLMLRIINDIQHVIDPDEKRIPLHPGDKPVRIENVTIEVVPPCCGNTQRNPSCPGCSLWAPPDPWGQPDESALQGCRDGLSPLQWG